MSDEPGGEPGPAGGYLGLPIGQFLDLLSDTRPDPGGGSVAALAVTLAAGLCVMTAGLSARHLPQAQQLAGQARQLRDLAAPLPQADADAYGAVLTAIRTGEESAIQAALSDACAVPMQVAEIGAGAAAIAAEIAAGGNPAVRGDAITAAQLAAAAARSAAALVRINLAGAAGDSRPAHAGQLAAEATRLATTADATVR